MDTNFEIIQPNRPLSIAITVAGAIAFALAAFELLPLGRATYMLCLFFGLTLLSGGVVLLLIKFEQPVVDPPSFHELLGNPDYEAAFKLVMADQSKRGVVDDSSLQNGIDYLVARGISPDTAWQNLGEILQNFSDMSQAEPREAVLS